FGMDQVQNLLGLRIICVLFQLPALDDRTAIGKLHAVQCVLNNDGALLGIFGGQGCLGCSRGNGRRRRGRSRLGWCRSRCRRSTGRGRGDGRLILLWHMRGRLWPEVLRPQNDNRHGKQRGDEDTQLRCEFILLGPERRELVLWGGAHGRTSCVSTLVVEFACISSHFSGTGSNPNLRDNGWQRSKRFVPSQMPRHTPNRSIAS